MPPCRRRDSFRCNPVVEDRHLPCGLLWDRTIRSEGLPRTGASPSGSPTPWCRRIQSRRKRSTAEGRSPDHRQPRDSPDQKDSRLDSRHRCRHHPSTEKQGTRSCRSSLSSLGRRGSRYARHYRCRADLQMPMVSTPSSTKRDDIPGRLLARNI